MLRNALLIIISGYRSLGSLQLGGNCRFEPSCSEYGYQAAKTHPPLTAIRLITARICRCRPGGPFGFDPLPTLRAISHTTYQTNSRDLAHQGKSS